MSLKRNLFKNGIANAIQKIIRVAEQLLLVPFFISAWGAAYYGEWLTLTIIPSILAFSELGFGSSTANKFMLKYASGDKYGAAKTANNGLIIMHIVVLGSILLSSFTILILCYFGVFEKSLISKTDGIWAVSLLMISYIIGYYIYIYEAYYKAARKAALSTNMLSLYSVAKILGSLLVLICGKGIIVYALINLIISVIFYPLYIYIGTRIINLPAFEYSSVDKTEIKDITKNGLGYFLSPIWQSIYFQGTTFIVRLTLGPVAVTIFNTIRTVVRALNQLFNIIINAIYPEFQFEVGAGNLDKARKLFRVTFGLVLLSGLVGILFLYFFGPWLYSIWTHKVLNPPPAMWNIFLLGILFNLFWWTIIIIFQAYNKPYQFTVISVIASLVSVASTFLLCKWVGLTGAAIGSVILDIVLTIYLFPKGCALLKQPLDKLLLEVAKDMSMICKTIISNKPFEKTTKS